MESKICSKCDQLLTLDNFNKRGGEKYLRTECKECTRKLDKKRKALKAEFGSAPPDHICPICKRDAKQVHGEGSMRSGSWVIDHDHVNNKFRGWLCHKCNRGLGAFDDDANRFKSALEYLQATDSPPIFQRVFNLFRRRFDGSSL